MPQSAQEWYDETRRRIDADGYRSAEWSAWGTWPFDGELGPQRELEPPGDEPAATWSNQSQAQLKRSPTSGHRKVSRASA